MKRSPMPARTKPMKRSAPRRKKLLRIPNEEEMLDQFELAFREDVHRRSGRRCERCRRPSSQIHHRRTRTVKWSKWLPENGIDLCGHCHHGVIHANVDWARRHGLILSRHSTTHPPPVLGCPLECEIDHYA